MDARYRFPWGWTHCKVFGQAPTPESGEHSHLHISVIKAPLPGPKPGLISLLEGGEDPWIPDVRSPEAVPGDLSPGEAME